MEAHHHGEKFRYQGPRQNFESEGANLLIYQSVGANLPILLKSIRFSPKSVGAN